MTTATANACCDATSPVPTWPGVPKGVIINIGDIEAYLALPSTETSSQADPPRRVLLFLTEVHGIYLPNAQLLVDAFAAQLGIPVLMPDQFSGVNRLPKDLVTPASPTQTKMPWILDVDDPNFENRGLALPSRINTENSDAWPFAKPPDWNTTGRGNVEFAKWIARHGPDVSDPILDRVIRHIHQTYGPNIEIGAVGYCFGGRYVLRLMGSGAIDVGVVNHPSFFTMEEVASLKAGKRLAIFAAERDDMMPKEQRREVEDVLSTNDVTWMSTVFGGTEHGFAVRGDLGVQAVRTAKERAFEGAVSWFRTWLLPAEIKPE